MDAARKITVEVPEKLLETAQEASGEGITPTVRIGSSQTVPPMLAPTGLTVTEKAGLLLANLLTSPQNGGPTELPRWHVAPATPVTPR